MKGLIGFGIGAVAGTVTGALGFAFLLVASAAIEDKVWIIDGERHQYIKKEELSDAVLEK